MRYPQVLVYEADGRLARLLQSGTESQRAPEQEPAEKQDRLRTMIGGAVASPFWLLEPRGPDECLAALRRGGPSVLVLKLGRNLVEELGLLELVTWRFPDAGTVAVSSLTDAALAGLAWDLGASYVLYPPQPVELLSAIVAGLLGLPGDFIPESILPGEDE
ncbi:MAG TPA: hypothetical protein VKI65_18370 [Gemmataceae bacterium]|nr:hypothetical protein [Gemmataceae bacterium]